MEAQEGWISREQGKVEGRCPRALDSQQCKNVTDTTDLEMRLIIPALAPADPRWGWQLGPHL